METKNNAVRKAQVLTDVGIYTIEIPQDYAEMDLYDAWIYVKKQLKEGDPFEGSFSGGDADSEGTSGILSIEAGTVIKHIKVYDVYPIPRIEVLGDGLPVEREVRPGLLNFQYKTKFAGQPLGIKGVVYTEQTGYQYYLPLWINTRPALEMLSAVNVIKALTLAIMDRDADQSAGTFEVMTPIEGLDSQEEAVEWLKDYVKTREDEYTRQSKQATSWPGWKGENNA